MAADNLRSTVTRRPFAILGFWAILAGFVAFAAPDLTRLAAEGQAHLLDEEAESSRGADIVRQAWPEQSYESQAVVALHRPSGLEPRDAAYARQLAQRFEAGGQRPSDILRVFGPDSKPAIAERLVSPDRTMQLVAVPLASSFVAPSAETSVAWLQARAAEPGLVPPPGLSISWTGDAAIGRDYMRNVQTSLDRAALATVVLLLGVLLFVYRSFLLALVPLVTIGVCLVISRGLLAWLARAGWEISPLVELFLIVLLFGSGTDFCLFVSWRFAEHWSARNPAGAMRMTLRRGGRALMTSAGTVFVGLMLMGTTRFKLFSSTGPRVALGLVVTLAATLTLTPALLILLARWRPKSFAGMTAASSGFWDRFAHRVLARPGLSWLGALLIMAGPALIATQTTFTQDTLLELPERTPSADALRLVASKFGPGTVAPLAIVLESDLDLHKSSGLALIDEVSRMLGRQRWLSEVRSATQPLGSTEPLAPARLSNRLAAVNQGFGRIETGARQLRDGLQDGLTKLSAARWLGDVTGLHLPTGPAKPDEAKAAREALASGLNRTAGLLSPGGLPGFLTGELRPNPPPPAHPAPVPVQPADARPDAMVEQLGKAVAGAGQIADGVSRASEQITTILADPVGRRALDRLLITPETVKEHPELVEAFDAYIAPDGKLARIDVYQRARMFSGEAMDQVTTLRRKLRDRLDEGEADTPPVRALVSGPNAESADIRALTRSDQIQSWFVIPIGVFVVLMLALRDPVACVNLVATMLLTYAFALGMTHLLFITILEAEGLDWKVPYFLFVLLVAVGVDYNVFLMARLHEETGSLGLRAGISRAVAQTGGLISSAAAITAISFASLLFSPLGSLRQLGFALVVGIGVDAILVRPLLVPCGQWLLNRRSETKRMAALLTPHVEPLKTVTS
jgi:RND superfamily putative drug exporter